jgi:hypothetical protein
MAVDYREVNQQLINTANQLPYQPTLFKALGGQNYFSKVDNLWGYHQLKMSDESSKVTAVITPWGVYRFTACPFGISTAPGQYQARMAHEILREFYLNGAIVYIDDTVIYGADVESFLSNLDHVLEQMVRYNVRLKPSKCSFGMESIEFLGHVFDKNGHKLTEERVQGIVDLAEPTSVKGLRSFIGMVNYFRDYISDLSGLLIPLTVLTKKKWTDEPFEMTNSARLAFGNIKRALAKHTKLTIINEVDPLILYTDASTVSVGGVLMQVQNGVEVPCQFLSQTLSDQATRWGIMELELYAFVFCVKQLAPYLLGRRFIVRTDHRNLLFLSNSTVPKLVRWRVILSEYQFTVEHIAGRENVVADGITRVHRSQFQYIPKKQRHLYVDDTLERVFRFVGEDMESEYPGYIESSDEDNESLDALGPIERHHIFSKFHNSMVGHFGIDRT